MADVCDVDPHKPGCWLATLPSDHRNRLLPRLKTVSLKFGPLCETAAQIKHCSFSTTNVVAAVAVIGEALRVGPYAAHSLERTALTDQRRPLAVLPNPL